MSSTTSLITTGIGAYGEIAGKTEETDKVQHSFLGLLAGSLIDASMGNKNQEATNVIDIGYSGLDIVTSSLITSPYKYLMIGSDINTINNSRKNLLKNGTNKADDTIDDTDNKSKTEVLPFNPSISHPR